MRYVTENLKVVFMYIFFFMMKTMIRTTTNMRVFKLDEAEHRRIPLTSGDL